MFYPPLSIVLAMTCFAILLQYTSRGSWWGCYQFFVSPLEEYIVLRRSKPVMKPLGCLLLLFNLSVIGSTC